MFAVDKLNGQRFGGGTIALGSHETLKHIIFVCYAVFNWMNCCYLVAFADFWLAV